MFYPEMVAIVLYIYTDKASDSACFVDIDFIFVRDHRRRVRLAKRGMIAPQFRAPGPTSCLIGVRRCSTWCSIVSAVEIVVQIFIK